MYLPGNWTSLTPDEQLFAVINLERVGRGLPPFAGLVASLDQVAQDGAAPPGERGGAWADPVLPGGFSLGAGTDLAWNCRVSGGGASCGGPGNPGASIAAGGSMSALDADYMWMYNDGYGGNNVDCKSPIDPGCWGHRDNILGPYPKSTQAVSGTPASALQILPSPIGATLVMGAGVDQPLGSNWPNGNFAAIFLSMTGPVPPLIYTWQQALSAGAGGARPAVTSVSPSAGSVAGGTSVTVTGYNLSGATGVMFGSTQASGVSVVSRDEITAKAPPGAGTVAVTVTTANGTSVSAVTCADGFSYGSSPPSPPAGGYTAVAPYRLADTRPGSGKPYSGRTLGACGVLPVRVAGVDGIPGSGTSVVVVNLTVVDPVASGYLTAYPAGAVRPEVSNLNFVAGQTIANLAEVPLSTGGALAIYNGSPGGANVAIDLEGYYGSQTLASLYDPVSPERICDTRPGDPSGLSGGADQCLGLSLSPGVPLVVQVAGLGSVPVLAGAAVINLTAAEPGSAGYVTAYPSGGTVPLASNVNFAAGQTVANRAVVELNSIGAIDVVSNTYTDVIIDVSGYYASSGNKYVALSPARLVDTRCSAIPAPGWCAAERLPGADSEVPALRPGGSANITVAGVDGVPLGATAAVLNVTVTDTSGVSSLTAYPGGSPMPTVSDLNWVPDSTVANLVIEKVGSGGTVGLYNSSGDGEVVVDLEGYYG